MADQEPPRRLTEEEEDEQARAEIAEWLRRRAEIPETEKHPIARPERFAGPIGADNEGNIITEGPDDLDDADETRQS
jgi:hypothetical protein